MRTCLVCSETRIKGLGLCENHLKKYRRGTLTLPDGVVPTPRKMTTDGQRFGRYVRHDDSGCWLWTGAHDTNGYGVIRIDDVLRRAHRWVYELMVGPIPEGLDLDHLCRVRHCVRPAHLEPVTRGENLRRGYASRRAEANG